MKSKAEFFHEATKRNALRREAKLPLINVREEVDKAVHAAAMANHYLGFDLYKDDIAKIRADILAYQRELHGPSYGTCAGSRRALAIQAEPFIRGFLATKGHPFPGLHGDVIEYGQNKNTEAPDA